MNWLDNMNHAVDYIEDTLKQKRTTQKLRKRHAASFTTFRGFLPLSPG